MAIDWNSPTQISPPRQYVCGYCNTLVGPNQGFLGKWRELGRTVDVQVFICSR
jgi:hypothetical protein